MVRSISAPSFDFLPSAAEADAIANSWPGSEDSNCMDGTSVAFERTSPGRIISGWGNADCDGHSGALR